MDHALPFPSTAGRRNRPAPDATLRLCAHAPVAGHLRAGACVAVLSGRVWLTQTGDANDHFVDAGQRHVVARSGRVVIESFGATAVLRVLPAGMPARPGFP